MSHNQLRSRGDKYEIPQHRRRSAAGRSGCSTTTQSNLSAVGGGGGGAGKTDGIEPLLLPTSSASYLTTTSKQDSAPANSAPQDMDEQRRYQAYHDSLRGAALTFPTPSDYELQRRKKDAQAVDQSNPIEPHSILKEKLDVHVPVPHSTIQTHKPFGHPVLGVSMPTPFYQPEAPIQCGEVKPQMSSVGTATSMPMTIPTPFQMGNPPLVQQQVFVPRIQSHPMLPDGTKHQDQGPHVAPQFPLQVMHKALGKHEEQAEQRQLNGILDKLTPQNVGMVAYQIRRVQIDNAVTLSGLTAEICNRAVTKPAFCQMYANLCYHLAGELPVFSQDDKYITFKRLLLNMCQEEFERGGGEEEANRAEEGEVKQPEVKKEEKRINVHARVRKLGNIQFLGELYKNRMLTERIIHECIRELLGECQNHGEVDIEGLCKLLTKVGKMIDHPKSKEFMDTYFEKMSELSDNMKLSSRMRFLLKDVIDQRNNNWQHLSKKKKKKMATRSKKAL